MGIVFLTFSLPAILALGYLWDSSIAILKPLTHSLLLTK